MKISVYAIAKNEEKFVKRWVSSMNEADEIIVLDTGSTDSTVKLLSSYDKVQVFQENIKPWRFDTARNLSLSLVPDDTDYCVCTDLDEVFSKGWRKALEKSLISRPDKVSYRYIWSFKPDGSEDTVFNIEKIHKRHGFMWTHPVHEVLTPTNGISPVTVFADGVLLSHHPDKDKSRAQYLPLLELSVKEKPEDDRNVHYLGREYMFYGKYDEAISMLKRHLALKTARWADERCASMRYISRCLAAKGDKENALLWLLKACAEAPHLREPWMETAKHLYNEKNWQGVIFFINKALEVTDKKDTYISDASLWKELPYDLLSIAYFYTGNKADAIKNADLVISRSGALTVTELCALGVPAVLIPLSTAAENHQFFNAKVLEDVNDRKLLK